jgi:DNA-binding SARP family transcriptional activator
MAARRPTRGLWAWRHLCHAALLGWNRTLRSFPSHPAATVNDPKPASLAPPSPSAPPVRLQLHAAAAWRVDTGAPQPLERKHAALLAWLWIEGPTPRSRLAGLLWPDASEDRARGNLRQRLLKLRQEAGELLDDQAGVLSLKPVVQVEPPHPPGAALLQSLEFDDCEAFARWLEGQRETSREQRKRDWLAQVREAASSQRLDDALYAADQLLQADRESEEAYRVLMEVSYLRGDHAAALNAWDRCRDMLRQLYGVLPSAATQQLGQTILQAAQQAQATQDTWAPTPSAQQPLPPSVLRPPQLVGRQAALQALVDGWHAGQLLVVAGMAGVGKSRLLADWQATLGAPPQAASASAAAAARPGDAVLPYASLSRLLLSAVDRFSPPLTSAHARQAARLLPRLATLAGVQVEPVQTDFERTRSLLALAQLLGDCVQAGCRAFVLDDLQFADPASLGALRVLAEPGRHGTALPFALGLRADEAGPEVDTLLRGLAAAGPCTRVDLQPLGADDAAALLASLQVPALDAGGWAAAIWRQVGGNPAFLLESVKLLLSSRGAPPPSGAASPAPGGLPLPPSIEAVIQRRIELLSPRARHLAQLAAIAGSGYSVQLAAAALACAPIELGEPLRELELRQVFYGRQFVHDVIASVTQRSVPAAVAEFMHRFVAEHLQQHGGDAAHIATHWRDCGEWRLAGRAFQQASAEAARASLANEQADLLDQAIAAFERDPALRDELFDVVEDRANVYLSAGHAAVRPALIARMASLAHTETQQLLALVHRNAWRTDLRQPVEEEITLAGIKRAEALGRQDLALNFARSLAFQWADADRGQDALTLLARHEAWARREADDRTRCNFVLLRAHTCLRANRLGDALEQGQLALDDARQSQVWTIVLPAMNLLGTIHTACGEFALARSLLTEARDLRDRIFGRMASGLQIDVQLGHVLCCCGEFAASQEILESAREMLLKGGGNAAINDDTALLDNHLAQLFMVQGRSAEAAAVLARDMQDVQEGHCGRRLTLRLRWQRLFGKVDPGLRDELQALASRLASPFNRALMELELARHLPPLHALAEAQRLAASAVAQQRPGLQLHAVALAALAARQTGDTATVRALCRQGHALLSRCTPFDLPLAEARLALGQPREARPGRAT